MIKLEDMVGTMVFSSSGNYIVGASERENAEFQKKCQNKININLQDCVELSCVKEFVLTSENYNDIMKSEWISHEGAHEAIIGPELWEAVQKINRATKQISTNNTPPQTALFPKPILTASQPLSENTPALKNSTASCFTN